MNALADLHLDVDSGLTQVMREPVGRGHLELGGSVTRATGPQAWLELGYHPVEQLGLFSRAFASPFDVGVMAGVRVVF